MPPKPLYNPWDMELMYCCTVHGPWNIHTIVQPMGRGAQMPPKPLYNPWAMDIYIIVQPMTHRAYIPLYSPWVMEHECYLKHCTTHGPWG